LGYWAVMTNAVFSFAGVESLAMAAAETQNPRRNIPKACKKVFARVLIFYILAGMFRTKKRQLPMGANSI
jgi:amino acid transporter